MIKNTIITMCRRAEQNAEFQPLESEYEEVEDIEVSISERKIVGSELVELVDSSPEEEVNHKLQIEKKRDAKLAGKSKSKKI